MKKFLVLAALMATGFAQAGGNYASITFDEKDYYKHLPIIKVWTGR